MQRETEEWHPTGKPVELCSRLENRFWEKVDWEGRDEDECWEWTAGTLPDGYGVFWLDAGNQPASRVAYALDALDDIYSTTITDAINDIIGDQCVLHRYHNPPCCNPSHLYLGSQVDNMYHSLRDGRMDLCLETEEILDIRERAANGETQADIAHDYGITQPMVSYIHREDVYNWVADD